jgi:hypothetical protein
VEDKRPYRERFGEQMRRTRDFLDEIHRENRGKRSWGDDGPPPF